ncbi:MAG: LPS-assembly protein LptD [Rhodothermia bacterium]|nr:LPS-assembly protein LptD [Rhodothermia bacterium]
MWQSQTHFFSALLFSILCCGWHQLTFAQPRPALPSPPADSLAARKRSPKQPIKFTADSLRIVFDEKKGDLARLAKNTTVTYDQIKVVSPLIRFYFKDQLVEAIAWPNAQQTENFPQFTRGSETFSSERLSFNLKTEQGRFLNSRTKMQDGFILGNVVKVRSDSTVFVQHGLYTTCDDPSHPHYSLEAKKMKIGRNKWIYTGPIRLNLLKIKLPVILPFGAIPTLEGRRSGPLTPSYGQDNQQGFYLKDWGWYWPINDYMDVQIRFGVWSLGSFQIRPTYRYAVRNRFNGSADFTYRYIVTGQRYDAERIPRSAWDLGLNHSQKINPYADVSANIRIGNSRLLRVISDNFNDRILSESSQNSNFSYNKRWNHKGRTMALYGSLSDNLTTRNASLTLPALRFGQRTQTPFQRGGTGQSTRFYENLQYDLDADLNTNYQFQPVTKDTTENRWWDGLFNPEAYRNTTGLDPEQRYYLTGTGNFRISMPYTMRKTPIRGKNMELTFSPNLSLREYVVSREDGRIRIWGNTDASTGVRSYRDSTFYRTGMVFFHDLNLSFSAGTTIYGTFPWKIGSLNGFRHVMRPSLSFSTRPTYENNPWNYFKTLTDTDGNTVYDAKDQAIRYPVNSNIPSGKSRTLGLSVENVLRTRTIKTDSTGTLKKNAFDLLNFGFSSGYNFAADSLQWQDVSLRGYTNIAGRLNLSFGGSISPYRGLTSFNTTFSTSLRSRQQSGLALDSGTKKKTELTSDWTDYKIPWSLGLNLSYGYAAGISSQMQGQHRAILDANFNFQLTEKWRVEGRSGFDVVSGTFTSTDLSVYRDLHCWEMAFSVRPFGKYQSFQFRLNVKSGKLRSILRLEHPKSDIRSSLTDILP